MKKIRTTVAAAAALCAVLAQASPPAPVDGTPFTIPAKSEFYACDFDLQVQYHGKGATRTLPGGRFVSIAISPGLRVTLTNLQNGNSATLNITGTFKQSMDAYGNLVTTVNGRNLLGDPTTGLVLVIGNFGYTFDGSNTVLLKPLSGTGQMLQACPMVQ